MSGPLIVYWNGVIADRAHTLCAGTATKGHSDHRESVLGKWLTKLKGRTFSRGPDFDQRPETTPLAEADRHRV